MQVYRTSLARCISSPHVRSNSADAVKSSVQRLAASWDNIHIPSRKEIQQAQRTGSLSSRLVARRPPPAPVSASAAPTSDLTNSPQLLPVTPRQEPSRLREILPPKRVKKYASPTSVKKMDVTLQSAADTLNDLFQVLPNQPSPAANESWEKGVKTIKQGTRPSAKVKNAKGRSWTPEGGNKVTGRDNASDKTTSNAGVGKQDADQSLSNKTENEDISSTAELNIEDDEDVEVYLDDTVVDGVSLLAPRSGQSAQLWYESIIQQNREPEGPRVIYPDIDISLDLHNLFGIDRAQQPTIMVTNLGVSNRDVPIHPAVKKGKVEYRIRKIMRRHGGDYSYLQPNLVPTDLKKMRPSQLARLTMSRLTEASTYQRKTFDALISSILKDVDTVEQPIRS